MGIVFALAATVFIVALIGFGFAFFSTARMSSRIFRLAERQIEDAMEASKEYECEHCGRSLPSEQDECPSCGAAKSRD